MLVSHRCGHIRGAAAPGCGKPRSSGLPFADAVVRGARAPRDPDLYGLWESSPYLPDKITIFRLPLAASFPDPAELEEEIRITVLHELAHYFGIDEDRLDELGYS